MELLGAKENIDQTQILRLAVRVRLPTARNEYITRRHRPRLAAGHMQRAAAKDDHNLAKLMRVQCKSLLRVASFNRYREVIGRKPIVCFEGEHRVGE
jgi:hypothetical protein